MTRNPPAYMLAALAAFRSGDLVTARREAEVAAQGNAQDPVLQHLAGVICCRLGDLSAGIAHLEQALGANPNDLGVRVVLARALLDSGKPRRAAGIAGGGTAPELAQVLLEAARSLGDPALEAAALGHLALANPHDAELRRAHGHALVNSGDLLKASEALDFTVQLDPSNIDARAELGAMLADLDEPESALAAYADAAALAADRADLTLGQARALTKLRRFDEASAMYARLLALDPSDVLATREFGALLERTGRIDALPALIEQAVDNGIDRTRLSLLEAMLALKVKDFDRAIALAQTATNEDSVKRYRLLCKIEEARGDVKAAFHAAVAMNGATTDLDRWRERGAQARREIRRLASALRASSGRTEASMQSERASPAFIVGFPRSGTTLLDTILMGHSRVAVLEEEPMLEAAKAIVGDLAKLDQVNRKTIEAAREAYFEALDERLEPTFDGLVIDKMPFNMLGADLIHRLFPDARLIFAQRHPCDVVLSGFMQSFRLNDGMASFLDLGDAADLYDAAMTLWSESRARLPLAVHDLVYEELVFDPEAKLRPLIAFLGLSWDPALLDHRATARNRGMIITPSYDQVTQPINRRAAGRWQRLRDELAPVLPILDPWARRLGYGPVTE